VPLQTVTLRHVPAGATDEAHLAAHNLAIARRVNDGGRAYLTPSVLKGQQSLRVSVGAETTERRHLEELWRGLQESARAVGG
jgi:aromatic-L-amino-acid decarboxylase